MEKNKKIYSLLIGLLSFFILVFFTTSIYGNIQENTDLKNQKQEELDKLNKELTQLNNSKQNLKNKEKISKFSQNFSEAEIFKYINDYIEQANKASGNIIMEFGGISFSEPKKSELGFREVSINVKLNNIRDSYVLLSLLEYLNSPINKYSFFITEFSFPIEKSGPYKGISIPLKMFIK